MAVLLPSEFVHCRAWGHAWQPSAVPIAATARHRWGSRYGLKCLRCGTERFDLVDARGVLISRHYDYAADYVTKGDDRPSTEELRLFVLAELADGLAKSGRQGKRAS